MKRVIIAAILIAIAALSAGTIDAKGKSIAGEWTLTVEQHFGLKLVLAQKGTVVTGRLDWPHGDPIKLVGALKGDTLTFTGDSKGEKENFTLHVDSTATLKAAGTMSGTLKALFVDLNEAHEVVRRHDQEIPWTAERGLHGIVNFGR
jgi:hypothetical protein